MKIAVWHNLPSGGGKRALYDHVKGLVKRGHTVEAWCPPTADRSFLPLSDLVVEHVVGMRWPIADNWTDRFGLTSKVERMLDAMDDHCKACAAEIENGGFDVLFANACIFFRTTAIGKNCSLPSVIYLGEPYRWLYEALPHLPWMALPSGKVTLASLKASFIDWREVRGKRIQVRDEYQNAAAFTHILVNSYYSRESILRAYGLDSTVCYLGIDTKQFAPQNTSKQGYVVGLGSITAEKNVRLCIEAVARTTRPHPTLVWIGNVASPAYLQEMRDFAVQRGVDLDVRVGISEADVIATLSRAALMIYAPRLEPFGLAPLEANACGTAVVAVAEGGVRETITNHVNGLLADGDAGAIAAAMQTLLDKPELSTRLGASGRDLVSSRWNLDQAITRLEECLAMAVAQRHERRPGA